MSLCCNGRSRTKPYQIRLRSNVARAIIILTIPTSILSSSQIPIGLVPARVQTLAAVMMRQTRRKSVKRSCNLLRKRTDVQKKGWEPVPILLLILPRMLTSRCCLPRPRSCREICQCRAGTSSDKCHKLICSN